MDLFEKLRLQFADKQTGKIVQVFQDFIYDNLPLYCSHCKHQGHDENTCTLLKRKAVGTTHDEEETVMQSEEDAVAKEGVSIEKLQGDAREFLNAKMQQRMEISKHVEVPNDRAIEKANSMLSRRGTDDLDGKDKILAIEENPKGTADSQSPVVRGNQPTLQPGATCDRANMEMVAAGQLRSTDDTTVKGTGQIFEAVATVAAVPIEPGQIVGKKKAAGDDRRLKDIPATTILTRMYSCTQHWGQKHKLRRQLLVH